MHLGQGWVEDLGSHQCTYKHTAIGMGEAARACVERGEKWTTDGILTHMPLYRARS